MNRCDLQNEGPRKMLMHWHQKRGVAGGDQQATDYGKRKRRFAAQVGEFAGARKGADITRVARPMWSRFSSVAIEYGVSQVVFA
jgi:hypothetical protein